MKPPKAIQVFILTSATLLLLTGIAKLISAFGTAPILLSIDPVFSIPFRHIFWMVGLLELTIASFCYFGRRTVLKVSLLALLATDFILYRVGLWWLHYHRPCSCLGNLTDALHIPPHIVNAAMQGILAFLLVGSYGSLFWLWRQKWHTPRALPPADAVVSAA